MARRLPPPAGRSPPAAPGGWGSPHRRGSLRTALTGNSWELKRWVLHQKVLGEKVKQEAVRYSVSVLPKVCRCKWKRVAGLGEGVRSTHSMEIYHPERP